MSLDLEKKRKLKFSMRLFLCVIGVVFSFMAVGQDVDVGFQPPTVAGADWQTDPFKYGVYLVFQFIKWGFYIGLVAFLIKILWGMKTALGEYMASRTSDGQSGDTGKITGLILWFLGGVVAWIIMYNVFIKVETLMQASFSS